MEKTTETVKFPLTKEAEEWMQKLEDPYFLPSHDELEEHLSRVYFNPNRGRDYGNPWDKWARFLDGQNKNRLSVQEILTKEYVDELSSFLADQISALGGSMEKPVIILEVGAGQGRLSFFLNQRLGEKIPGQFKIIATDIGVWRGFDEVLGKEWEVNRSQFAIFPIELLDHKEAVVKYRPDIVICSWMPSSEDWTADLRKLSTVKEYILIGEPDSNATGLEWATWGNRYGKDNKDKNDRVTPHEKDGFERQDMYILHKLQLSRLNIWEGRNTSSTTLFKKK